MRLYLIAFQFLTIIPLPFSLNCKDKDLGRSMAFFPLVGLTIGGLLVALDAVLSLCLPRGVTDLLLLIVMTAITGGLHLDGMADVCDALAARGGAERFLAVMKDPRCGAIGVAGVVLLLMLKYQLLLHLPQPHKWGALLLFPTIGRFSQVQMTFGSRKARNNGLGAMFIDGVAPFQFVVAAVATMILAIWLAGWLNGLIMVVASLMVTMFLRHLCHRNLGGITGDLIGCVSEINELLALLIMVGMAVSA